MSRAARRRAAKRICCGPENTVERVDAIVLSGGSAFGLAAADGVMDWLAAHGRGFAVGAGARADRARRRALRSPERRRQGRCRGAAPSPYRALGSAACDAAQEATRWRSARVGAGTGATTADLKGGFGAAETVLADGSRVAAFVAVNAVGRVTLGTTPHFRAAPFERDAEFGGLGLPAALPADAGAVVTKGPREPGANTTLAVVATDCALTRAEAKRLAIAAHDGIALAIYPRPHAVRRRHGLCAFDRPRGRFRRHASGCALLCAAATDALARAIARAVYAATPSPGRPLADLARALRGT